MGTFEPMVATRIHYGAVVKLLFGLCLALVLLHQLRSRSTSTHLQTFNQLRDDDAYDRAKVPAWLMNEPLVEPCQHFWQNQSCHSLLFKDRADQHSWPNFLTDADALLNLKGVILVVPFNNPNYKSAIKVHALYHRMFSSVFYCGPDDDKKAFWDGDKASGLPRDTAFLPYGKQKHIWGETFYQCVVLANQHITENMPDFYENERFKGLLVISDDVLLNVWMLKSLGKDLNANWLMHDNDDLVFDVDTSKFCFGWRLAEAGGNCSKFADWRGAVDYAQANQAFYDELTVLASKNSFYAQFSEELATLTGGKRRLLGNESGDVFYLTKDYLKPASEMFKLFNKHRVFVEVAVPSVLKVLTPPSKLQLISAVGHDNGLGHLRDHAVDEIYGSRLEMMHPLKTGSLKLRPFSPPQQRSSKQGPTWDDRIIGCVYCNVLRLTLIYNQMLNNFEMLL